MGKEKFTAYSFDTAEDIESVEPIDAAGEESSEPVITTASYSFSETSHTESFNPSTISDYHRKRRRKPLALAMGSKAALSSFLDFYMFKCYNSNIGKTVVATALRHPILSKDNQCCNLVAGL